MKARFVRMEWENQLRTIASFYFEPASAYRFEAGQYASLSLPHPDFDSRGFKRTMTISSSPTDKLVRFTMRLLPVGGSSFKAALCRLQAGQEITLYESMGDLVLPLNTQQPLVFIAGGVGIASFSGMTQYLADSQEKRAVTLHYAVARPGDVVLQAPFEAYSAWQASGGHPPMERTLYTPSATDWPGTVVHKRIDGSSIAASSPSGSLFYVSGTEAMVEAVIHGLQDGGINRQDIIFDFFDGYSEL